MLQMFRGTPLWPLQNSFISTVSAGKSEIVRINLRMIVDFNRFRMFRRHIMRRLMGRGAALREQQSLDFICTCDVIINKVILKLFFMCLCVTFLKRFFFLLVEVEVEIIYFVMVLLISCTVNVNKANGQRIFQMMW